LQKTKEFLENYSGKSITEKDEGMPMLLTKELKWHLVIISVFLNSGDILLSADYHR